MPKCVAKAWKNSRTSSVSKLPILARVNFVRKTRKGRPGKIDRDAGQSLVHRQMHVGEAADAARIAQRLAQSLAKRDAGVFDRVVRIDMQVAFSRNLDVDERMACELLQHMVEKADPRRNFG